MKPSNLNVYHGGFLWNNCNFNSQALVKLLHLMSKAHRELIIWLRYLRLKFSSVIVFMNCVFELFINIDINIHFNTRVFMVFQVCREWEEAAQRVNTNVRLVVFRTGVVLGLEGGALGLVYFFLKSI